jgi:hypothetical protein
MEQLAVLDTSLNKSQSACSSNQNTDTSMNASANEMVFRKSDTTGTAKGDGFTCYNCGQVDHISCNCPNCNLIKHLFEQALVYKVALNNMSGCPPKDKKTLKEKMSKEVSSCGCTSHKHTIIYFIIRNVRQAGVKLSNCVFTQYHHLKVRKLDDTVVDQLTFKGKI